MADIDLYNYPKRLEGAIATLDKFGLSVENKRDIISFSKIRLAKGSSHGRVAKVVYCMRTWANWIKKPFRDATKDDLIMAVGDLENTKFSEYTRYDLKIVLKMFYKWLEGNDETFPSKISWMKPAIKNENHKLPEELLTEAEILKLADVTGNLRDKALILVLAESGCRIGELLTMKLKNVVFDQYGAILRVNGKTGDRRVRVISSAPALAAWLEIHPTKNEPEGRLWYSTWRSPNRGDKGLSYGTVHKIIQDYAIKAGIKKRVYPHLFRHSRATALANKLTESQMKEHFGWVQGSDMAATYVHLSGRDVDNALLKLQGLVHDDADKEEKIKIRICPRCKDKNSPISRFCNKCGLPLDENMIVKIEEAQSKTNNVMNKLWEDAEYVEFTKRKLAELGIDH